VSDRSLSVPASYQGSTRNFRRPVADATTLWRIEKHRGRRPAVWSPGEDLVIDRAQAAPGRSCSRGAGVSRGRLAVCATDQRTSTTLVLIAHAFTRSAVPTSTRHRDDY
jgi:hypothetical protein